MTDYQREIDINNLWQTITHEAQNEAQKTPLIADLLERNLIQHQSFGQSLARILAEKLSDTPAGIEQWQHFLNVTYEANPQIVSAAQQDLLCQLQGNASIKDHYTPLLYFGGFHALQCHRVAHHCWHNGQAALANYIQGQSVSMFGVDIHPAAKVGCGIFIDHAVGIVVGETAVIEDAVTLFQSVTLGGTGKGEGDRHPKIRRGAFIGSGAVILGNIEVGEGAKIAAGAVVTKPVAAGATVVGPRATPLN